MNQDGELSPAETSPPKGAACELLFSVLDYKKTYIARVG
jgi:hypothetical protein